MNNTNEGATPEPVNPATLMECMGRWRHSWVWVWEGAIWTNEMRCTTCDKRKTPHRTGSETK